MVGLGGEEERRERECVCVISGKEMCKVENIAKTHSQQHKQKIYLPFLKRKILFISFSCHTHYETTISFNIPSPLLVTYDKLYGNQTKDHHKLMVVILPSL